MTPRLRFKEFHNPWKLVNLDNIADIVGGGTPDTENSSFWNGEIQWFTPSEIGINKFVNKSQRTITDLGLKNSSAKLLPINTLLFTSRATIGEMSILTAPASTNQGFQSIIVNDKNNFEFVYYLQNKIKAYSLKMSYGSTFLEISKSNLQKCQFYIPELEEQTKIATFLNLYYKKIELQKKKIELLHNMFKWVADINLDINKEEMYIENLVDEFIEKSHTENQYPILSSTMNGIFLQNEYFTDNVITQSNIGYKIVPYNYFTYRSMSDTGKFVFNLQRLVDKGIVSPAYPVFNVNEKCLSDFLYYYLNYSKYIKKQLLLLKEGGTRYALGFEKFKKLKVVCLTLEEQQVIVKNLDVLKSKFELEKQKLETMEKYKQGLLQQLFI